MSNFYLDVDANNYNDEVIKSDIPVLIDFWAPWCGPCRTMSPIFESLATKLNEKEKKVKFIKVNVDENQALATQFQISSIPCFIYMESGVVKKVKVGVASESQLLELIS